MFCFKLFMTWNKKLDSWIANKYNVLLRGKSGVGKCLGKGTPILMYDGSIKKVEDIKVNDLLMGPDSTPRKVLSTCSGKEKLYKITPIKGDAYIVNASHILSLVLSCNSAGYKKDSIININVEEFLKKPKTFQKEAKGYRTKINFNSKQVPLDPYFIGLWLGDGTSASPAITTADTEVVQYLKSFASIYNLFLKKTADSGKSSTYSITSGKEPGQKKSGRNPVRNILKDLNLINNKHIPLIFKINDEKNRLELLAGLIDSDGHRINNCYEIITKSSILADDILYLARSLGFAAYKKDTIKGCTYKNKKVFGNYFRIYISGDLNRVPVKLSRKVCSPRQQIKNVLRTGIKLKDIGEGDYYGFEIDGDRLFVLGDFTVTHNTAVIKEAFERAGLRWIYFSAATMDPWTDLMGIPKEMKAADGTSYLDFVRPKHFQYDAVDAIFLDEFNRVGKRVKNSLLELIQFQSINGKKFNNLKMVWAAINPDDDPTQTYDVEPLDPAQLDRFQIIVDVPYFPDVTYFVKKFGAYGEVAVQWWKELDEETKNQISPRRLDYAMIHFQNKGDLRDVLPARANITKLITELQQGSMVRNLKLFFEQGKKEEAKEFLKLENNYMACEPHILKTRDFLSFFLPLLPEEKISTIISKNIHAFAHALTNFDTFEPILMQIEKANLNKQYSKKIRQELAKKNVKNLLPNYNPSIDVKVYHSNTPPDKYSMKLAGISLPSRSTNDRQNFYWTLKSNMSEKMCESDALKTLDMICDIISHSQELTIHQYYKLLIPMINHAIIILESNNISYKIPTKAEWFLYTQQDYIKFKPPIVEIRTSEIEDTIKGSI